MSDKITIDFLVQVAEFKQACERNGVTDADIKKMCIGDFLVGVRRLARGEAVLKVLIGFETQAELNATQAKLNARSSRGSGRTNW